MIDKIELTQSQIDLRNTIVLEILGKGAHIEELHKDQFKPSKTTLTNFFSIVKDLVDLDNKNSDQRILVTETMPDTNFFQDPDDPLKEISGYILTTLLRREPATLVGGNDPFNGSRRDLKPKLIRKIIGNDPERPGEVTYVISKMFDNLVGLNICSRTNKRADFLADWFEDLMEKNRWYFELNGFSKYFFLGRLADLRKDDSLGKMSFRPFKYYVRTETYYYITEQELNRILVKVTT
jgi:hypothetical protein